MFDMLRFAIQYCAAIDTITAEWAIKLCDYKLGREEWNITEQLCDILEVCCSISLQILLQYQLE